MWSLAAKDPLRTCHFCRRANVVCKRCSQCQVAFYCSKECQKNAYSRHKNGCSVINRERRMLARAEEDLCNARIGGDIGRMMQHAFGLSVEAQQHFTNARFSLADELIKVGIFNDNYDAFEESLEHFLDMLRDSACDASQIRLHVPFVLLVLGRKKECYNFIKSWATVGIDASRRSNRGMVGSYNLGPDGDYNWGFPRQYPDPFRNCLKDEMEDLFEDYRMPQNPKEFCRVQLFALILLKILVIRDIEKSLRMAKQAFLMGTNLIYGKDSPLMMISDKCLIIDRILYFMDVNSGVNVQRRIYNKYCAIMDDINPRILKGVVNPAPLLVQPLTASYTRGSAAEAHHVLFLGVYAFSKTSAVRQIEEKYGKDPTYDYKIDRNSKTYQRSPPSDVTTPEQRIIWALKCAFAQNQPGNQWFY